ncbi:MAG TPA: hypothetical protein PLJ60_02000 [Chryseolinea sp.]|nr:hypothetical protein [Chryseolinea sp.]HPM29082.1 hypothetical protein [Chryseolinea sp.]
MSWENSKGIVYRVAALIVVVLMLLLAPIPLLPPHRFSEAIQGILGVGWKPAYLAATILLQLGFYGALGIVAAFMVVRAQTVRKRLLQVVLIPIIVIGLALIIRSAKGGYFPIWINTAIPMVACCIGVWLGLGLLYQRLKLMIFIVMVIIGVASWGLFGGTSPRLTHATRDQLRKLVSASASIPPGEKRFVALLRLAFAPISKPTSDPISNVDHNRAAILALGIVLGDEHIAQLVGLDRNSKLVRNAVLLRKGTTLRGRADWSRHFSLSAALAVLENSFVSDAGGLIKEQVDTHGEGSGFSFTDIAADRAGVRFAEVATSSDEDALAMQQLLKHKLLLDYFFPSIADLPEGLTPEQFRNEYHAVGSPRYREMISEIEIRLDSCVALSPLH